MTKNKLLASSTYYSVITICFNDCSGLVATYESLLSQDFLDFEWIVVDGGSTDGTKEFLESLDCSFPFQWVSEGDHGIYNAMNKGLQMVNGRYLIFMNSNDRFCNKNVMTIIASNVDNFKKPVGIVYGDSIDLYEDGKEFYRPARDISFLKFGMVTHHQSMVFASEMVGSLFYNEDLNYSADYQFICEVVNVCNKRGEAILKIDDPIASFSLGGAHQLNRKDAMKEDYYIRKKVMGMTAFISSCLYVAHYIHMILKKRVGFVHERYRYKKS